MLNHKKNYIRDKNLLIFDAHHTRRQMHSKKKINKNIKDYRNRVRKINEIEIEKNVKLN